MALTYLNSKMIEEPANFDQLYVISLTALSSTVQNTLTNDLTAINVTGDSVIDVDTPGNALRVTQRGIGNALVVEDSANPDSTPFVVNSLGRVGIGVASPTTELDVNGTIKGTNITVTSIGTIPAVVSSNVTTQNLILPANGSGGIVNNATFYGNLSVLGTISFLSGGITTATTLLQQTSSLSIINSNSDVALYVEQSPNLSGVATFIGSGTEVLKINNPNPNPLNLPAVVVNGVLSASGGNSTNWNNTFTNVQSNSANWNSAYATTTALSSNLWNDVYTSVQSNSAQWASNIDTGVRSVTGTYATISFTDSKYVPTSGGTINGNISSTGNIFTSAGPVVVSSSTLETPTTGISAINNIVALSQATYDALTVKLSNTFYIIV